MLRGVSRGSDKLDFDGVGAVWSKPPRGARRLFPQNRHDFGMVPRGVKVKHDFLLVNRLAEPITILNLRPSCGCTSGQASASVVGPGQSAVIEAQMDTRKFVGPKSTILYVSLITASGREAEVGLGVTPNPQRRRAEPRSDRFRDGHARPVAGPGPDDRPDQRRGLAIRADVVGVAVAQRQARRDFPDEGP